MKMPRLRSERPKLSLAVAQLAQKLRLTKSQLANPKIVTMLEEHLQQEKKMLAKMDAAPPAPTTIYGSSSAVNHGFGIFDYENSKKGKGNK